MTTNRIRKILTLLLALSMLAAACGGSDETNDSTVDAGADTTNASETADDEEAMEDEEAMDDEEAMEDEEAMDDEEAMEEASHSSDAILISECGANNSVALGDSVTDLSVAIVAPSDSQDLAFTQSMIDSLTRLGIEPQVTDGTFQVEVAADAIRGYAEDGLDVVVVHGTQYGGSLAEIAPDFPETSFIWGTSTSTNDIANVFAYYPEAQEGGYVNGWIAGAIADGGSMGVVGPVEAGDAVAYINGFSAGAEANGASNVAVTYTGSFSDVALATEAAEAFLITDVDVLTGTSQSTVGAVNVADENEIPWFGTQSNQEPWSADQVVASQVYHWEVVLDDIFEMIEAGTLGGEAFALTLENGGLVVEINGCFGLDDEIVSGAGAIIDQIISGDITPPA